MEVEKILFCDNNVLIKSIKSYGHKSPKGFWYDQDYKEIACVTKGSARLVLENGQEIDLIKGQSCVLNPHLKHRIEYTTDDCEWLCVLEKNNEIL